VEDGERDPGVVGAVMAAVVAAEPLVALDYVAVVDAADLTVPAALDGGRPLRLLIAANVGGVRLIDNAPVPIPASRAHGGAMVGARDHR
jgi:pantoate--beta-alanine ligase